MCPGCCQFWIAFEVLILECVFHETFCILIGWFEDWFWTMVPVIQAWRSKCKMRLSSFAMFHWSMRKRASQSVFITVETLLTFRLLFCKFIFNYVYALCMGMCMGVKGPQEARRGRLCPGADVADNCEPPDHVAGNWTWVPLAWAISPTPIVKLSFLSPSPFHLLSPLSLFFSIGVSLFSPGWPRTCSSQSPASVSWVLG